MDVLKCVKLSFGHGVGGCPKGNGLEHPFQLKWQAIWKMNSTALGRKKFDVENLVQFSLL